MHTLTRNLLIGLLLAFATLTLSACGNKGPLFVPQSEQSANNDSDDTTKASTSASTQKDDKKK